MPGVILAHPRCGSSELARALRVAADVSCPLEPFHKAMRRKGITPDGPRYPEYLEKIMREPAIKHMWNGLSEETNRTILSHPSVSSVVFLYRRDALQAALSTTVAKLTKNWDKSDRPSIDTPLPLEKIAGRRDELIDGQTQYLQMLRSIGKPFLVLAYEDVYTTDDDARAATIRCICHLFRLPVVDAKSAAYMISPDHRYNSEEFYQTAPNWSDFEERFRTI